MVEGLNFRHHIWHIKNGEPFDQSDHLDDIKQILSFSLQIYCVKWYNWNKIHRKPCLQIVHSNFWYVPYRGFLSTWSEFYKELKKEVDEEKYLKNCGGYHIVSFLLFSIEVPVPATGQIAVKVRGDQAHRGNEDIEGSVRITVLANHECVKESFLLF